MDKTTKSLKAIALSLGLAAAMLPTTKVTAQNLSLLDEYYDELDQQSNSGPLLMRGTATINDNTGGESGGFSFADFGEAEPSPLGSGIAILIGAGLGYVALKKKEDEQ